MGDQRKVFLLDDAKNRNGLIADEFVDLRLAIPDFQNRLTQEMKKAESNAIEAFVAVLVDEDRWLVDLKDLKSTEIPSPISRIGMTKPWALGITSFRGTVHMVVDMRSLLRGMPGVINDTSIVTLISDAHESNLGLLWPELLKMIRKEEFGSVGVLEVATSGSSDPNKKWIKKMHRDAHGLIWNELDIQLLVQSDEIVNLAYLD